MFILIEAFQKVYNESDTSVKSLRVAEGKAFQFDTRIQEVYGFETLYAVHYDQDTGVHGENGGESRDKTEESCRQTWKKPCLPY